MDDLKMLFKVVKGLVKLTKNIHELMDTSNEEDPISEQIAEEYSIPEESALKILASNDQYIIVGKFLVSKKDFGKLENGKINRLMDCLNFTKKGKDLVFHSESYEKYKNSKNKGMIMHYVPAEDFVNAEVIMDDRRILKCAAESSVVSLKPGDIVQAERMFYCVLDSVNEGVCSFWFMHP